MGCKCDLNCFNKNNIEGEKNLELEKPIFEEPAPPAKNINNNNINTNVENVINTESKQKLKSKKKIPRKFS
jgi:hypothetical protein